MTHQKIWHIRKGDFFIIHYNVINNKKKQGKGIDLMDQKLSVYCTNKFLAIIHCTNHNQKITYLFNLVPTIYKITFQTNAWVLVYTKYIIMIETQNYQ